MNNSYDTPTAAVVPEITPLYPCLRPKFWQRVTDCAAPVFRNTPAGTSDSSISPFCTTIRMQA